MSPRDSRNEVRKAANSSFHLSGRDVSASTNPKTNMSYNKMETPKGGGSAASKYQSTKDYVTNMKPLPKFSLLNNQNLG
jgi:aspartyl aminopeptidase